MRYLSGSFVLPIAVLFTSLQTARIHGQTMSPDPYYDCSNPNDVLSTIYTPCNPEDNTKCCIATTCCGGGCCNTGYGCAFEGTSSETCCSFEDPTFCGDTSSTPCLSTFHAPTPCVGPSFETQCAYGCVCMNNAEFPCGLCPDLCSGVESMSSPPAAATSTDSSEESSTDEAVASTTDDSAASTTDDITTEATTDSSFETTTAVVVSSASLTSTKVTVADSTTSSLVTPTTATPSRNLGTIFRAGVRSTGAAALLIVGGILIL